MNGTKAYKNDFSVMLAFHDALRRELGEIARATSAKSGDPKRIMEAAAGWQMFKSYLHAHHTSEDELLWPIMAKALAERPDDLALLTALEAEHSAINPLLEAIDATLVNPASPPERLAELTEALSVTLRAHLRHEENEGLPLVDATVSEQQWQDFGAENGKRIASDAPRFFPWMLDGLEEDKADHILQFLPEQLRGVYRAQWLGAYRQLDLWGA